MGLPFIANPLIYIIIIIYIYILLLLKIIYSIYGEREERNIMQGVIYIHTHKKVSSTDPIHQLSEKTPSNSRG